MNYNLWDALKKQSLCPGYVLYRECNAKRGKIRGENSR